MAMLAMDPKMGMDPKMLQALGLGGGLDPKLLGVPGLPGLDPKTLGLAASDPKMMAALGMAGLGADPKSQQAQLQAQLQMQQQQMQQQMEQQQMEQQQMQQMNMQQMSEDEYNQPNSLTSSIIEQLKQPILVAVLVLLASLPFTGDLISKYVPKTIDLATGKLNMVGLLVKALLFGVLYFGTNKFI